MIENLQNELYQLESKQKKGAKLYQVEGGGRKLP